MRVFGILLMLVLGCGLSRVSELRAQSVPPRYTDLEADTRVRLLAPAIAPRWFSGRVLRVTPDTLILQTGAATPVTVALAEIDRIERSLGRSHGQGALRGLGYGALIGGASVGALVLAGTDFCIYISCLPNDLTGAVGGFFIGAVIGAPVGTVIGALVGVEEWRPLKSIHLQALHIWQSGLGISLQVP